MTRRCVWVLFALFLSSCAARGASPQLLADLGRAHALVSAGCYACLTEALGIYERVAASRNAPAEADTGAFKAALLIAVRSRELGLPADAAMTRARLLAARVTPAAPLGLSPASYLDAAALISGETSGLDPETREQDARERRAAFGDFITEHTARTALTAVATADPLAAYLAIAVDCTDARARQAINVNEVLQHHDTPLMRFRLALCALGSPTFARFRQDDRRWADTLFFEGRREMTRRPVADVGLAAELFLQGRTAFPASTAMTMALAAARNALSEYDTALGLYDAVLADAPTHRDALLGRVMSLSYLNRHRDAIISATRMIDLGRWHLGDAYYWRSWNHYQQSELDPAWSDIEMATTLNVSSAVYMLAGVIAYARKELNTSIDRLDRAFRLDNTNCEAVWTEGLVHVEKQTWPLAAARFSRGMSCFASAAAQARKEIAETEVATYAESVKTRRLAAAQKRLETAEHRTAQSAFNAASSFVRLGEKSMALSHIDVAADHALLKEKAVALKAVIERLP